MIAVFEAAGAGLPLLLSNLPWQQRVIPARNIHFANLGSPADVAPMLSSFHASSHRAVGTTFPILSWHEVALRYVAVIKRRCARRMSAR